MSDMSFAFPKPPEHVPWTRRMLPNPNPFRDKDGKISLQRIYWISWLFFTAPVNLITIFFMHGGDLENWLLNIVLVFAVLQISIIMYDFVWLSGRKHRHIMKSLDEEIKALERGDREEARKWHQRYLDEK